jgi:hypothetical protein
MTQAAVISFKLRAENIGLLIILHGKVINIYDGGELNVG